MKLLRKLYVFIAVAVVFSSLSMLSFAKEKEEVPAESIALDLKKAVIGEGQKLRLHATLSPADSTDKITWTSKDPSVATMSKKGLVKADGKLYYFGNNGAAVTGWKTIGGKKYFFSPSAGGAAATASWMINGKIYQFGSDGVLKE